ncbi:MAG: hypothetical protein IH586_16925, partial [Anaerolineaceae bacterium]|nr:hypothetical protein [Anaerolineaceae bacterium]
MISQLLVILMRLSKKKITPKSVSPHFLGRGRIWGLLVVETVFAIYFYALMEWLFFVTKPSFMDVIGFGEKFSILLSSAFIISFLCLLPLLVLLGISAITPSANGKSILLWVAAGVPSVFLCVTSLLLIDNFTYTIFKFGIVSTAGFYRGAYGLGFL